MLENINSPADLKTLSIDQLKQLADEIRDVIVRQVASKGGHLASSLGTVELTLALHTVYNTPEDKLVWDVGHQAYPHKLVTGRYKEFHTLKQFGGLSGFLKRSESEYDAFGAGHATTSLSAAPRPFPATVRSPAAWPTRPSTTPARSTRRSCSS